MHTAAGELRAAAHAADGRALVTAVAQDADTGRVLMLAWMDAEALQVTLETRRATYYSRSRQELWVKGATSGATQEVVDVQVDCDGDAILLLVRPAGPACHTGLTSCFDTASLLAAEDRPPTGASPTAAPSGPVGPTPATPAPLAPADHPAPSPAGGPS